MQKPQGRGLCVAIEVLSVSALVAATGDGAMGLAKTICPSAPATIFGKLLAPSRREATAHGVQHEPGVKDAEGRRSRLETRSITFSSARTVRRTEFPLRTAFGSPP
jgi:hypothetical protein